MPRSKQQFQKIRNQKIELIEGAALKCFAKYGFHNTSMDTIAKEAGISTGLTYNYFSSKDELLKSIYLKGMDRVFASVQDAEASPESFIDFIEHIFNEMETNTSFWKLYFIVMSQPEILEEFRKHILKAMTPIMDFILAYLTRNRSLNPEIEAQFLFSTLDGICINFLLNEKEYPLLPMKEKIMKMYVQ